MANYVKLGSKAESFNDAYSGLSLAGKEVAILTPKMSGSGRVKLALQGGHLVVASEAEFKAAKDGEFPEIETIESKFGKTAEELTTFYKNTYEVSKKQVEAFKKRSLESMVKELTRLEDDQQ